MRQLLVDHDAVVIKDHHFVDGHQGNFGKKNTTKGIGEGESGGTQSKGTEVRRGLGDRKERGGHAVSFVLYRRGIKFSILVT